MNAPGAMDELRKLTRRLGDAARQDSAAGMRDCCRSALLRLHLIRFSLGDRDEALEDLLDLLGDGRRRVPQGLVELLGKVGTFDAVLPLARLYAIEQCVSWSGAQEILQTIREIARREGFALEDVSHQATSEERTILERILHRSRSKK
jgi:hypothetical protein